MEEATAAYGIYICWTEISSQRFSQTAQALLERIKAKTEEVKPVEKPPESPYLLKLIGRIEAKALTGFRLILSESRLGFWRTLKPLPQPNVFAQTGRVSTPPLGFPDGFRVEKWGIGVRL